MNDPTHDRAPAPNALTPAQEERLRGILLNQIHAFAKYYGLNPGAVVDSVARLAERRFYRASIGDDAPAQPIVPAWIDARIAEIDAAGQERDITPAECTEHILLGLVRSYVTSGRKLPFRARREFEKLERERALTAPLPEGVARFRLRGDAS